MELFTTDKALSGNPDSQFISGDTAVEIDISEAALPLAKPPIVPLLFDVLLRRIGELIETIFDVKSPVLPAFKAIIPGGRGD